MFKSLFEGFHYKRMAFGVAIFAMGHPVIFFLRDGLKLAPQSSVFTAACLVLGLFLMIPSTIFQKYYSLNNKIAMPVLAWIGVCLFYFFIINPGPGGSRELINYAMTGAFLFMLLSIPDEVKDYALPVFIVFILAGNLGLFYSLYTNPHYVLGARASIYFDDEYGGNPHVFSRNGFAGVIGSVILLFMTKENFIFKAIAFVNLLASIVTVILTQSRATLLSVFLSIGVLMFFHFRLSTLKNIGKTLTKPVNLVITIAVVSFVVYKLTRRSDFINLLLTVSESFWNKFLDVFETAVQGEDAEEVADYSAIQRVMSFNVFKNSLLYNPISLILGNGYKATYMDFPILEAMYNYGIAGFYFFGRSVFEIIRECYRCIKDIVSPFSAFLGFIFIPIAVSVFSGGQPSDTTFLFPFLMMARFMDYDKEVIRIKLKEAAQKTGRIFAPVA
ncbi:hypothetical protein [Siphonobacter sp. SORGH_AS_0500]|uniref:hypothetical protein n=1 Tax=Siphonobacter sp. SORGH_AS_0500 TaxID=1864824 RepID=UPI0028657BB8|nr:hypothetical protein [Siphonobacter sp. SORGH_AS_0500]MDR6194866.1 hypothetical protein [Siphonobacter sp. SORGH_AS_0500]